MQLLKYIPAGLCILVFPTVGSCADDGENVECDFDYAMLVQDYWPVLQTNPLDTELKFPPAIDVFVGKDGKPLRYALVSDAYITDKDILSFTAQSLIFDPAYACGEPVDSFYRHLVRSYFTVEPKDAANVSEFPVALFSLPKKVLDPLFLLSFQAKSKIFDFTFVLTTEGKVARLKGLTSMDKVIADRYLNKFLSLVQFKPAALNGQPVEVAMHLKVDMSNIYTAAYLSKAKFQKPMPVRTSDILFPEDRTYSVLLDFYNNGAVRNIQFLTLMNREESLTVLEAFRSWRIRPKERGEAGRSRLKVEFGFPADGDEALLLKEEFGEFSIAPKPLKQTAPVYPPALRKAGAEGTVLVTFLVNEEGRVVNPKVVMSSHQLFSEATITALKKWRFRPGMVDGKAVTTKVRMPIPYRIRK